MNMRKIIAVLSAVLMLCAIIPMGALSVSAAGPVYNANFENNSLGGWKCDSGNLSVVASSDAPVANPNGGNYVMKKVQGDNEYSFLEDRSGFTVEANTDYTVKVNVLTTSNNWPLQAFVSTGTWINGQLGTSGAVTCTANQWHTLTFTFNSGSNTKVFASVKSNWANTTLYVDNFVIWKTSEMPFESVTIYQEDFEGASAGAWANSVTTLASSSEFPVANAACGNYAMKMAATNYSYTNYVLTVEKNTTYKVTFSILSATNGYPINARIRTAGGVDLALYQYTPSTTAWETHSYTFNSGENTSVNFRFQAGWATGTYYIDNLSVATCEEPVNDGHISNGDFEAGNTNWIDSANTAVVEDPTGANQGLVMSTNEAKNATMFSQTAKNLKANTYYNLSFKVYGYTTAVTNAAFWVRFANTITDWTITQSPNGSASANAYTPRINVNTKLNAWYPVNIKFNTGDLTETVINFMNYRTDGGQYYFDDIIVFEDKDPSYDGYIYNGDFECGTTSNWSSVSGGITHNAAQVHDGTFALSLYTNGGWGGVGNQTIKNLEVGNQYYVSMWVRSDGAYINGVIQDSIINPDTNKVGTLASFPIRNNYTDWHFYDVKFTATETTATLNFSGPGSTSLAGYGYVDSIKIEAVCDRDGHTAGAAADCENDQVCTVCGDVLNAALGHSYEAVVTAPDCENGGYTTYTCSVCGDSYVADETEALGHTYDDDYDADCNVCGEIREVAIRPLITFDGKSASSDVSGLAFKFTTQAAGVEIHENTKNTYKGNTGVVVIDGVEYTMKYAGAILTNQDLAVEELTIANAQDNGNKTIKNIGAKYLWDLSDDSFSYAVRITNIPEANWDTVISARPYFVYADGEGNSVIVYGDVQSGTYNEVIG